MTKKKTAAKEASATRVRGRPPASIRSYCEEHGNDRDTTARKLTEAGISPVGDERGHPVYRERDLHLATCAAADGAPRDPHRRKAYFAAELDRVKLAEIVGELAPRSEVETMVARFASFIVRVLKTLPDKCERDEGLAPRQVAYVERVCREARAELAAMMRGGGDAPST